MLRFPPPCGAHRSAALCHCQSPRRPPRCGPGQTDRRSVSELASRSKLEGQTCQLRLTATEREKPFWEWSILSLTKGAGLKGLWGTAERKAHPLGPCAHVTCSPCPCPCTLPGDRNPRSGQGFAEFVSSAKG